MNADTMTEPWSGSLGHLGILSTFKEEPSDKECHDEMMDIIKEAYAMDGGPIGLGEEDFFGDIKKPQQDKQKPFGYSNDDIMESWLQSSSDLHYTFPTQLHPFTHILPVDEKEHVNSSTLSIVKKEKPQIPTTDIITDARNESAMNFLLNSCVDVGDCPDGNFEGIQATDMCSLLEQFETVSAQLNDDSTNVTPSVSQNVTPAVSANVSPCVSTDVTPCVSANVTPAISAPPSPMMDFMDVKPDCESIIVNVMDISPEDEKLLRSQTLVKEEPQLVLIKEEPALSRVKHEPKLPRVKKDSRPSLIKQKDLKLSLVKQKDLKLSLVKQKDLKLPLIKQKDPKLSLMKQKDPKLSLLKQKDPKLSLIKQKDPKLSLIKQEDPKFSLIKQKDPNLSLIKRKDLKMSSLIKQRDRELSKISLIKQEKTPTVSPACTPPSTPPPTPPPEVIEKIKLSNKRKSAILLPMGMPSKRGRGHAMPTPVHCTTPKMQKLVKQNYGTPTYTTIPKKPSATCSLPKKFEKPPATLIDFDHDYCFVGKRNNISQATSENSSVVSLSSNDMKIVNEDSNSSDLSEFHANVNLDICIDKGSVLKALLISGNKENTEKALAEAAELSVQKENDSNNCEDSVQVNIEEIENFERTENKSAQSTQNKNTFKGKEHRSYRKKDSEDITNTFDKLPGYCTTLSRPYKSSKQDILRVSSATEQPTIERDVSPERQTDTGYSKLPAYHNCFTNSTKYDRGMYILSASEEEAIRNAVLGERRRNNRRSRSSYSSRSASSSSSSCSSRSRSRSRSNSRTRYRSRSRSMSRSRLFSRRGSKTSSRHGSRHSSKSRHISRSRNNSRSRHSSVSRSRNNSRSRHSSVTRSHSRATSRSRMNRKPYNSRKYSNKRQRSRSRSWTRSRSRSWSRSRSRSLSSERGPNQRRRRSRSPSYELFRDDGKSQQIEERRIIYVGNIPQEFTQIDLMHRFERFGEIEDVSVHFREHGDNYGFVTFAYTCDAYAAKENGNKIPGVPKFDLCFGGRRQFCKTDYADLDGNIEIEEEYNIQPKKTEPMDFDMLLKMAQKKIKR